MQNREFKKFFSCLFFTIPKVIHRSFCENTDFKDSTGKLSVIKKLPVDILPEFLDCYSQRQEIQVRYPQKSFVKMTAEKYCWFAIKLLILYNKDNEIKGGCSMPIDYEKYIAFLEKSNAEQAKTNEDLRTTIKTLQQEIANLNETLDEFKRMLFGTSSEKTKKAKTSDDEDIITVGEESAPTTIKEHTRTRKPKSVRKDLYAALPVKEIPCDIPESERLCPDCDTRMVHLGSKTIREELRVEPAKVYLVRYVRESLICPVCKEEGDTTIIKGKTPTALMAHSPASPSMVAQVMYNKVFMDLPFYRQSKDWKEKGVPLSRDTMANWFNYCAREYFTPLVERMHRELLQRDVIHADEVPCQVLHEEGKDATSKSYMWIYLSGTDGKPPITIYDYRPGRSGDHPIEFLDGFTGLLHCDGYSAYGRIQDVILVCCTAHCRRKFFEAVPAARRKKLKLLDINSEQEIDDPATELTDSENLLPAEKGVLYCNRLFYLERQFKELAPEKRKQKRLETEAPIWEEFFDWLATLNPTGGSKLEKAVNYAINHKESLMNYLLDGRCELSNNAAERKAKSYVMARKNFLFHNTAEGANATAMVFSLVETAKANNLNVFQYLYMLLLYMPDYKNEPAGIEQLLPWSEFIQQNCTGLTDTEKITPETRGNLPL